VPIAGPVAADSAALLLAAILFGLSTVAALVPRSRLNPPGL
jgi:hypothetical protein